MPDLIHIPLPNRYHYGDDGGIVYENSRKEMLKVVNVIPMGIYKKRIVNQQTNTKKDIVGIVYCDTKGIAVTAPQEFPIEDIMSCKFAKHIPIEVIVEPSFGRRIGNVFKYIIQSQLNALQTTEEFALAFGWNGNGRFHFSNSLHTNFTDGQFYQSASKMASIITKDKNLIPALLLAIIHGPMKHLLKQAGITHDFVTFYLGRTAVGKSSLADAFCSYLPDKKLKYSFHSDRKDLIKTLQGMNDVTLLFDDYCKTSSGRTREKLEQTVSEIIQISCDSGYILTGGEKSADKPDTESPHLVITGEKPIYNESTLNRCFLVYMDESLSQELWDEITQMRDNGDILIFMVGFMQRLANEFQDAVDRCRADYRRYLQTIRKNQGLQCSSINRLAETMSVQMTLANTFNWYLGTISLDERLRQKVFQNISSCIESSAYRLIQEIDDMVGTVRKMRLLPALAQVILFSMQGDVADSENKYFKCLNCDNGQSCIGINVQPGFLSLTKKHMLDLIAKQLNEDAISEKEFDKEIRAFPVMITSPDSEGKNSRKWGTQHRMYHIHVRGLLEWTRTERAENTILDEYCSQMFDDMLGSSYDWISQASPNPHLLA